MWETNDQTALNAAKALAAKELSPIYDNIIENGNEAWVEAVPDPATNATFYISLGAPDAGGTAPAIWVYAIPVTVPGANITLAVHVSRQVHGLIFRSQNTVDRNVQPCGRIRLCPPPYYRRLGNRYGGRCSTRGDWRHRQMVQHVHRVGNECGDRAGRRAGCYFSGGDVHLSFGGVFWRGCCACCGLHI